MAKRASSSQFVTVLLSLTLSIGVQAANLTIGYQTGIDPSKVPQADGLYEQAIGEKIDWRRFNSGPQVITAIASGDVQIGNLGSSPLAAAASRNLPIVAFIVSAQINSSEALVVRNGSQIDAPKDLIGKTIATPFVSTSHYSLLGALKHWGLDTRQVKVVNLQPAQIAAAWKRGDIDGAFVWSPALGEIRKTGKTLTDATEVGQWGAPTFEVWVVRKDFAEKHPEVVAKFAKITLDSFADYAANKSSWTVDSAPVQKIARLTGANAADIPELLEGSTFPDAQAQRTDALLNGGTAKAIGETAKFLKEQGKVETVLPDYSAYVTGKFIKE
ncbi:taurine ABC transporter substrate-binding protein [Pseudomonas fluorescens]|jgi:taurine transport system substrate-binding protein|uniref:taurine ABC transporter substrate-binding protein n=1 Tax=Pseudomonas TaxID=286 RepID=UPI000EA896D0|nr:MULTISPECIES: taurine ABC transporter substrate-binding protein [Pseudomonas]AYG10430.1 taurine ABC transporter substrate-binding protein [Pseudomonas fluorescens]MDZ4304749.1 taurine ABC transporter substrate-binding protein [Pseudomonas sp.]MBJ2238838.1 taurine ABC transporter substrate-binding protein [Pseudomonas sp. MF6768]MBJ2249974.1 taurine ABC transporter substrate-binding protein [Pseudomonas sp. MF6784]MBJ2261670.1 taurine ABC transporter substrate-binding protein [Pseudomonas sp